MGEDAGRGTETPRLHPWLVLAAMLGVLILATAVLHLVAHSAGATVMLDPGVITVRATFTP